MKTQILFIASASMLMLASCNPKEQQQTGVDLLTHELQGNVKQVAITASYNSEEMSTEDCISIPVTYYAFDQEGKLISEDSYTYKDGDLKRDEKSRIASKHLLSIEDETVDTEGEDKEIEYTYGEGYLPFKVITNLYGEYGMETTEEFEYDAKGNMLSSKSVTTWDGNIEIQSATYSNIEKDEKGNWISRWATITITNRILDVEGNLVDEEPIKTYCFESRQIEYFE